MNKIKSGLDISKNQPRQPENVSLGQLENLVEQSQKEMRNQINDLQMRKTRLEPQDEELLQIQQELQTKYRQMEKELQKAQQDLDKSINCLKLYKYEESILNEMGELFQSCQIVEDVYTVIGEYARKLFPGIQGVVYVLNKTNGMLEGLATWGGDTSPACKAFQKDACWALRRRRVHVVEGAATRLICRHMDDIKVRNEEMPYICAPLIVCGEVLGLLHLVGEQGQLMADWKEMAVKVARWIAFAISYQGLRKELRDQSIRDPLTNLYNRRYMENALDRELSWADRHKRLLAVIIFDIDHSKRFYNTYGHQEGNTLIQEFAAYIDSHIRSEDYACRFGEDVFVIILPEAELKNTSSRINKLREGINYFNVHYQDSPLGKVTVSAGAASFPEHGTTADELLKAADEALKQAKEQGRDRVVIL